MDHCNLITVTIVFDNPNRIFYGLREERDGGWCYIGKPQEWWIKEGVVVPFPDNLVFAVNLDDNLFVYGFRAEYAAADDPLSPKNWDERYTRLAWKK